MGARGGKKSLRRFFYSQRSRRAEHGRHQKNESQEDQKESLTSQG